ncbi:hypothetical protein AXFE_21950 [Acidithrix ferrooxidans]|uniref:Uncharacterized protein n=1 Tax=Acidithrix ferrooxidans TaxID=1280514 RepID=A0A0D8HGM4_9ACTN|nr:hypothetical protein AXFE_21950 [Acidithrix ferrooxidans]
MLVACVVDDIRLHHPLGMIVSPIFVSVFLSNYYWGSPRGEIHLLWLSVGLVEISVAYTFRHEGLNVVAFPLAAIGIVTMIGAVVVYRKKTRYHSEILN